MRRSELWGWREGDARTRRATACLWWRAGGLLLSCSPTAAMCTCRAMAPAGPEQLQLHTQQCHGAHFDQLPGVEREAGGELVRGACRRISDMHHHVLACVFCWYIMQHVCVRTSRHTSYHACSRQERALQPAAVAGTGAPPTVPHPSSAQLHSTTCEGRGASSPSTPLPASACATPPCRHVHRPPPTTRAPACDVRVPAPRALPRALTASSTAPSAAPPRSPACRCAS